LSVVTETRRVKREGGGESQAGFEGRSPLTAEADVGSRRIKFGRLRIRF
jgi:hypothetical protein